MNNFTKQETKEMLFKLTFGLMTHPRIAMRPEDATLNALTTLRSIDEILINESFGAQKEKP